MKRYALADFTRGWFIGDFEPSIVRTKNVECMVRWYKAGESEPRHVHRVADEITVVVSGKFMMNDILLEKGDMLHLAPGEPADFRCIEEGATAVTKMPSIVGDKYVL